MAIETTPLGFQKPDGGEALRNGDDVIRFNADKTEQRIQEDRGRLGAVESKNVAQDTRLTATETKNTQQDGRLTAAETRIGNAETAATTLTGRVTTAENKNTVQDARLTTVEGTATNLSGRMTTAETKNTTQDARLNNNEAAANALTTRVTATESKNTVQDGRLTNVEYKNTTQDTRLTAAESKNLAQDGRLNTVEGKVTNLTTEQTVQNGRIAQVENAAGFGAPPLELSDEVVAGIAADTGSVTRGLLDDTYADAEINRKSTDFDFTAVSPTYHEALALAETSVLQSFVINEATNEFYASQVSNNEPDVSESITFSRLTIGGALIDSMKLRHGGHGTTFGIENVGADVYIWSNIDQVDGTGAPIGYDLCRFKYVPGAVYSETSPELTRYNKFTTAYMTPVTDQKNGTIGFRTPSTKTVQLRTIADVKAGIDRVLGTVTLPDDIAGSAGAALDGDHLYWYTGDTNAVTQPTEITRFSFTTGAIEKRMTVDYGRGPDGTYEFDYREPEGIYLYTNPGTGAKTLFGAMVTGQSGKRRNKIYGFHSLGNEALFIGNKLQKMQAFKLTEATGAAFRLGETTALATRKSPGTWYITTAESSAVPDHPEPGVAGWYFQVTAADSSGGVIQSLTKATSVATARKTYERQVNGNGTTGEWVVMFVGSAMTIPAGTTTIASLKAGQYYLSTADSTALTDHPMPGVAGWFLDVSKPNGTGDTFNTLRRATGSTANIRIITRQVNTGGNTGWVTTTGAPIWTNLTLDPAATVGYITPAATLTGVNKVELNGSLKVPGTYTQGMVVATLPAGMWPSASRRLLLGVDDNIGGRVTMMFNTAGQLKLYGNPGVDKNILLDGHQFYMA